MKDITPSADLGEMVVALLKKPHAPVSREFIDRMLNKKKDVQFGKCLGDTLIWLHLVGRIQRDFHKPETHPNATETTVWFWIADIDYDGYINAEPDFSKYNIVSILQSNDAKTKKAIADGAATVDEAKVEERVDPDQLIGDDEPEMDLSKDPDVAEDFTKAVARIPAAEPAGATKTLDVRILEWAAQRDTPWTRAECRAAVNGSPATFGMRLSFLVKAGKIQCGLYRESEAYWLAEGDGHPEFRANIRVGFFTQDAATKTPMADKPPRKMRQPKPDTAVPNLTAPSVIGPEFHPASAGEHIVYDWTDPKFSLGCDGTLSIKLADLTVDLSPAIMDALAKFGRRCNNLFGAT